MRCHECKRVMTPWKQPYHRKRDGSEGIRGYYVCRNKDLPCSNLNKYHDLRTIDFYIVHRLVPFLRDPELTREGLSEAIRQKKQQHDIIASQARNLMGKKDEAGKKLDRLLDEFAGGTGITADKVRARCSALEQEMGEYDEALKRLQVQLADLSYEQDHQKIEAVVSLFHQIASSESEYPPDIPGLRTLQAIWEGSEEVAWEELRLPELTPDHPLVKIANSMVKYVTIGLNSNIVDYRLRITPRPVDVLPAPDPSLKKKSERERKSRAIPIGQPEPVVDVKEDDENYKAKRNSITMPSRVVQWIEWHLPRV